MRLRAALFVLFAVFVAGTIGCSSNNTTATSHPISPSPTQPSPSPTPTPPSPTPAPTPTPTPPPTPPPTGTSEMHAAMVSSNSTNGSVNGMLTLNANGSGAVALTGVTPSATYSLGFCQFPGSYQGCPSIATVTTDGSGNGKATFQLTQKGTFAGVFVATTSSNATFYGSGFILPATGDQYLSPLLRASTVTGGIGQAVVGNEPLGSGQVTVNNSPNATVTVKGALPNHTYGVTFCLNTDSSSCQSAGSFVTDAGGNGSANVQTGGFNAFASGVYHVDDANGVQYITAFTVQ